MAPSPLQVRLLPLRTAADADLACWRDWVCQQPAWQNAFLSPRFAQAVEASQGGVQLLTVHDRAGLLALLPLQRLPAPWGRFGLWQPAGGLMSDAVALLQRPGSAALRLAPLLARAGVGTLHYTHVDAFDAAAFAPSASAQRRIGLRIRLDDDAGGLQRYLEALAERDRKLVSDTARRERKLVQEQGPLRFSYRSTQPEADLERLLALKGAQYERTQVGSPLASAPNQALLRHLLTAEAPECAARLSTLHCGERLVAAHLGLRSGPVLHYWFPVYDPEFKAYAPGRILLREVLQAAFAEGVRCIDRGEGDSAAKRDFANESHRLVGDVLSGPGVAGLVSRLALALRWRFRA